MKVGILLCLVSHFNCYVECHISIANLSVLSVIILNIVMLSVVRLSVGVPQIDPTNNSIFYRMYFLTVLIAKV
jgi:hypothetical protein